MSARLTRRFGCPAGVRPGNKSVATSSRNRRARWLKAAHRPAIVRSSHAPGSDPVCRICRRNLLGVRACEGEQEVLVPLRRLADTSSVRRFWSFVPAAALAGLAFAAVLAAGTLVGPKPIFPDWLVFPLGAYTLAVFGVFVIGARQANLDTSRPFAGLRPLLRWALILVAACAVIVAVLSGIQLRHGGPERHGATYFRRNHAELTRISRVEYLRLERANERLFSMGAIFFLVVAFGSALSGATEPRSRVTIVTPAPPAQ